MKRIWAYCMMSLIVGGCATNYTYNRQYDSKEKFQQAVDSTVSDAVASVTVLPAPLNKKKLLMAMPSEQALYRLNFSNFVKINGHEPNTIQVELMENLTTHTKILRCLLPQLKRSMLIRRCSL